MPPPQPAAAHSAPRLQTTAGPDFGDGAFQPQNMVTIHGVNNLQDGLRARVIAFDPAAALYVVKDPDGKIWGVDKSKLRPMQVLDLTTVGDEWADVPEGATLPAGVEVRMCMTTGSRPAC